MMPYPTEIPPHFKDLASIIDYSMKVLDNMSEHSLDEIIGASFTLSIASRLKRQIEIEKYSFEISCTAP